LAAALVLAAAIMAGSGCVVAAVASVASAVIVTTVKTTGKVTETAVSTTGRVVVAAVDTSGSATVLTLDSAGRLARVGQVVTVEAANGAVAEVPWRPGLQLYAATQAAGLKSVRIFRTGQVIAADMKKVRATELALQSGNVVELHR
jgi:hypothetical protein